jgi:hypothetical protein
LHRHPIGRLIDLAPDGRRFTVHELHHRHWTVDDPSPAILLALLREPSPRRTPPLSSSVRIRSFFTRSLNRRAASGAPPDALPPVAPEGTPAREPNATDLALARLATRILATRAPGAESDGPAGELALLARELAGAWASRADAGDALPGMDRLRQVFALRADEADLLLLAALVEVDPRAARMVALVNDHMSRPRPTLAIVRDLDGELDKVLERLHAGGPLLRHALLRLEGDGPLVSRSVVVDDAVWPLALGLDREPPFALHALTADALSTLAVPEDARDEYERVRRAGEGCDEAPKLVLIAGESGVGRRSIALAIAAGWRRTALVVDGAQISGPQTLAALSREALWAEAAVIVTAAERMPIEHWRTLVERLHGPLLATTASTHFASLALGSSRPVVELHAPPRDTAQRLRLWRAHAPATWPDESLRHLAERFDFGADEMRTAVALSASRAAQRASPVDADRIPTPDMVATCEALRETRFAGTAERIACLYEPDDIVLRPETRRELDLAIAWARHAARLFGSGGAGAALRAGEGLTCLFSGPPGGGKTMAAQIVARQIDYALYRIDLSQVVDKYIGESEKKLASLFDEAERARVALFFDEADALFGKRTEVRDSHDRYANITVDYLLQRIEGFSGLAILASNFPANIDDAFLRRIRVRASFPAPDAADRCAIWNKLLPAADRRAPDIDVPRLAHAFELVGGEIRNAIYTAHLLAAEEGVPVAMRHCVAGLWRELNKTGRIANAALLGPWKSVLAAAR